MKISVHLLRSPCIKYLSVIVESVRTFYQKGLLKFYLRTRLSLMKLEMRDFVLFIENCIFIVSAAVMGEISKVFDLSFDESLQTVLVVMLLMSGNLCYTLAVR